MPHPLVRSRSALSDFADETLDEDRPLVVAAQQHPQAFAPLYLRYVGAVYAYCRRRLGTKEAAEDATSLIFAKALAALPRYRTEQSTFRAWLFTIAHNVVIDSQRTTPRSHSLTELADLHTREPGPDEVVLAAEEIRTVRTLLCRMTPDQQQVLELRLAGLSTAEISVVVGRRTGAIRAIQFRAVARLRTLLGHTPGSEQTDE